MIQCDFAVYVNALTWFFFYAHVACRIGVIFLRGGFKCAKANAKGARGARHALRSKALSRAPRSLLAIFARKRQKKIAPVDGCVWVSRKTIRACYTLRYNVSFGNIV